LYQSTTLFAARVFIRDDSGNLQFGISNTGTANFATTPTNFTIETTYLCVVKYTFADKSCSLWVFSSGLPTSEIAAGLPEVIAAGSGRSSIIAIALRQYSTAQDIIVDGIRISDSWSQAPLPVELTSFTAAAISKGVMLNWSTATEVNNYGFSIERRSGIDNRKWQEIGFTDGHGNSNSPKDYSFMDSSPPVGEVSYRLKQIDIDGAFEYSDVVTIITKIHVRYGLYQNHPNPFNPSTQINYSLAKDSRVNITVYNSLGQKIIELLNKKQSTGIYNIELNAGNLASGLYFYRLETPDYSKTMKMVLIK